MIKEAPETLILIRGPSSPEGTFGSLWRFGTSQLCYTCEDPWDNNKVGQSCIPTGSYVCKSYSSAKYKDVWEVMDVPGRVAILIHNGNTIADTRGCILVGSSTGELNGKRAVLNSRETLDKLRKELPDKFILKII